MFSGFGSSYNEVKLSIDGISTSYLGGCGLSGCSLSLYLRNMNLTELPAGVFDGVEYLRGLHLQGNKLRTLPEGIFRNLSSLNKLDLQGNKLRTLPEGLFQNLSSLSQLYLHGNSLRTLPEGLFRNLRSLWELHLQRNKLRTFRDGHFRNLSSLKQLDLQGNCLRTLPKGLFQDLSGLRYLYLQNNGLEELPSSACAKRCWFDFLVLFAVDDFPSFALNSLAFLGNDSMTKTRKKQLCCWWLKARASCSVSYTYYICFFYYSQLVQDFSSTGCSNFIWLLSPNALRTLCRSQKTEIPWPEKPKLQLTPCGHVLWTWFFL